MLVTSDISGIPGVDLINNVFGKVQGNNILGSLINFTVFTASNASWTPDQSTTKLVVMCIGGGGSVPTPSVGANSLPTAQDGSIVINVSTSVIGTYAIVVGGAATASSFIGTGLSITASGGTSTPQQAQYASGLGGTQVNSIAGGANTGKAATGAYSNQTTAGTGALGGSGVVYVWEFA